MGTRLPLFLLLSLLGSSQGTGKGWRAGHKGLHGKKRPRRGAREQGTMVLSSQSSGASCCLERVWKALDRGREPVGRAGGCPQLRPWWSGPRLYFWTPGPGLGLQLTLKGSLLADSSYDSSFLELLKKVVFGGWGGWAV